MASTSINGWNVIVCGDLPKLILLYVPEPDKCTVVQLKEMIEEKTKIPRDHQVLYFKEKELDSDKEVLKNCSAEMRNGIAICVGRLDRFIINVQNADNGVQMEFKLPPNEAQDWLIAALRRLICYRFGIKVEAYHMLAIEGITLEDNRKSSRNGRRSEMVIRDYEQIKSGCMITLTLLSKIEICRPFSANNKDNITLPLNTSKGFANEKICHSRLHSREIEDSPESDEDPIICQHAWDVGWTIYIKQLDGTKTSINIPSEPQDMSVFRLREMINERISVPTYQQRLVCGETILCDWSINGDSKACLQLLSDYQLYDGITISLVILTTGIQIWKPKEGFFSPRLAYMPYINIPCPDKMTVRQLESIINYLSNSWTVAFHEKGCVRYKSSSRSQTPASVGSRCKPDQPVSSLTWLSENNYQLKITS